MTSVAVYDRVLELTNGCVLGKAFIIFKSGNVEMRNEEQGYSKWLNIHNCGYQDEIMFYYWEEHDEGWWNEDDLETLEKYGEVLSNWVTEVDPVEPCWNDFSEKLEERIREDFLLDTFHEDLLDYYGNYMEVDQKDKELYLVKFLVKNRVVFSFEHVISEEEFECYLEDYTKDDDGVFDDEKKRMIRKMNISGENLVFAVCMIQKRNEILEK